MDVGQVETEEMESCNGKMRHASNVLGYIETYTTMQCITTKFDFDPTNALRINHEVKSKLTKVHFSCLFSEFGLSFLNK